MTEESDWSYASKQKLAVVKAIKGKEVRGNAYVYTLKLYFQHFASLPRIIDHSQGGRALLGILGGGMLPGCPNPDPIVISHQKMSFSTPV